MGERDPWLSLRLLVFGSEKGGVSAVEIVILEENCEVRFILTHRETRACARQMETDTMRIFKNEVVLGE